MKTVFAGILTVLCLSCGGHRPTSNVDDDFPDELKTLLKRAKSDCISAVSTSPLLQDADRKLSAYVPYALSQITTSADSYSIAPTANVKIYVTIHSIEFSTATLNYVYEIPIYPEDNTKGLWFFQIGDAYVKEQGSSYNYSYQCNSEPATYSTSYSAESPMDDPNVDPVIRSETEAFVDGYHATVRNSSRRSDTTTSGTYCINETCANYESQKGRKPDPSDFVFFDFKDQNIESAAKLMSRVKDVNY